MPKPRRHKDRPTLGQSPIVAPSPAIPSNDVPAKRPRGLVPNARAIEFAGTTTGLVLIIGATLSRFQNHLIRWPFVFFLQSLALPVLKHCNLATSNCQLIDKLVQLSRLAIRSWTLYDMPKKSYPPPKHYLCREPKHPQTKSSLHLIYLILLPNFLQLIHLPGLLVVDPPAQ
jgi:hypothetical protein